METPFKGARYFYSQTSQVGIVLLHAYSGSVMDVNLLANKLKRHNYSVLCPLFKGHGSHDIDDLFMGNPDVWQMETRRYVEWMNKQGFEDILIFGLSMGGIFATWALSQEELHLSGGGVFNSPVITNGILQIEEPFNQYAKFIYQQKHGGGYDQVKEKIMNQHRQQIDAINQFKDNLSIHLASIYKPFFIGQSLLDEMIDPSGAKLLAQRLINAHLVYHEYPDNTHVITVNRNRQKFEADLINFIEQVRMSK